MISEFMAQNNATLADEDGAYSDWIEIYNPTTSTVNLAGWYLANSAANPMKWQFPSTNLGPNRFLIVFASNKNRAIAGAPLHTNFKLGASGEYLALVMPDGLTKATEFAPAFPQQYPDIAYGYPMTGTVTTISGPAAPARAFIPGGDIGTGWRSNTFNDSSWLSGSLGVGYDTSSNYSPAIALDVKTAMLNVNSSAYVRVPFSAANPAAFQSLTLSTRYDDGFIAYLNGTEVLRRNAPTATTWNSAATNTHGAPTGGTLMENFEGGATQYTLSTYGTAPSPAVQPAGTNSTGSYLRLLYDGVNGAANTISFRQNAPGLFQTIVGDFDFRINTAVHNPADGFAFMLIPTSLYGATGAGVNITSQAVEKPDYPGVFGIGFGVYPHTSVNDVSAHWSGAQAVNVTMPTSTLDLASGVFHHAKITLAYVTGGARVTVTLTKNINGTPGTPYSPITNFFIAGMNPFDCRVQFGARTGGLNMALDLDNINMQFLPPQGPIAFEDFDITPALNLLLPGQNLLAIQGLNVSAGSSNFLIQPQVLAKNFSIAGPPTYLSPATPGTWNNSPASAVVPAVTFFPHAGVYASNSLAVTLGSSSSSAVIRYTLDGSTPTTNSPMFTNAIVLTTNATVRAQATDPSGIAGQVAAANYVLLDPTITNFTSNLPLIIIDTLGQSIPDGSKVSSYCIFMDTNTPTGRVSLNSPPDYIGKLGIGLHGSSSLGFPKKTFAIELDDESGDAVNFNLLGLPSGNDWLLYPSYDDKTLMNNVMTYRLYEAMGHYAVRTKYAELFLHTSAGRLSMSDYYGLCVVTERIRVADDRVNVATLNASDNTPPDVTGGYLFSKDKINAGDLTFTTSSGEQLIVLYPKGGNITTPQYNYLNDYCNTFEAALYGANWLDPVTGYAAYIDADAAIDYHWIVEYSKNIDGIRISDYIHKDRNGKIVMGPIWDWDLSWGNANYAEGGKTNGWYYTELGGGPDDLWLNRLRTDPDFYQKIIDRWAALRLNLFNPTNLFAGIDQRTNLLWEAKERDFAAWPRLGTYVWPNPDGAVDGWDVDYVNPTTYSGIISEFKKYIQGRYLWIDSQFIPAPSIVTNTTLATLSAPIGSIYYTLNGSDPRAGGGGISSVARLYSGPIPLSTNAGIFARAFYTNAWSGPVRATYVAAPPPLRITEINYHPAAPPTNSPYSAEDFEFIEVQNTGASTLDLNGFRISGGIDFTFGPNQLVPLGGATSNNFDGGGTTFVATRLGNLPGPYSSNGPSGNMLGLLNSDTNAARNRLTFSQTSTGACNRIVADFDYRAFTSLPPGTNGSPTVQDFDNAGAAYTLANYGATPVSVQPPNAGSTGSYLRLVPADGSELGTIAFNRSATGAFNIVVATFDFRIVPPAGGARADGMGFALLNTGPYGTSGAGPGFAEEPSLSGSIGIGFDVYANASTPTEPNNNHVSLHWNSAQIGNAGIPTFDMANGKFNRAQIIVKFLNGNAYVTVRLTPDINGTPGAAQTLFQDAVIAGVTPFESRVAFGARTGGLWAEHDLDNVNVQFSSNGALSSGLSMLLLPVSQFGASGPGTTLSTFTDLPLVGNTVALDLSFNPANLANDAAIYWNGAAAGGVTISPSVLDLDNGVFNHARLQIDSGNGGAYAALTLTSNSLGAAGTPINVFSNLFMSGASPGNTRIEFAARNGGLNSRIEFDNAVISSLAFSPMLLAPGASIVVVKNRAAFESRYGTSTRVAGEYSGALDNRGDHLVLLGPVGETILDFSYDPNWYPITDGDGFSLVIVDPNLPPSSWGLASSWRPSRNAGGSPSAADPAPITIAPIVINEALANTVPPQIDRIELFNPTGTNVDISGWYLSDAFGTPQKFRIPNGTQIGPGGFVAFTELDFNPTPGVGNSFALNGEGDDIWLFSATTNGDLTGYVHGYDFGASDEGVSFGRYVNSQGREDFVAQISNSFGAANSGPAVGPLVISEMMYQPPATFTNSPFLLEYLEVQNVTSSPLPLYSSSVPTETWHLRDAITFDFPPNIVLAAAQRALVLPFDPVNDPVSAAAFQSAYPSSAGALMFGPWQGHLQNSDERVELRKPGALSASGKVPSVLVEAIHYHDAAPWPVAAAGQGSSLQRATLSAYGNDPTNWFAAGISPGSGNFSNQPPTVSLSSPIPGAVFIIPGNLALSASASDADGSVVKVEFFTDGIKLGEKASTPYSFVWTNPPAGPHALTAKAWDNSGNSIFSAAVNITATRPTLSLTRAGANLTLSWPTNSANYGLYRTTNLITPVVWLQVTNTPVLSNGQWTLSLVPAVTGATFYRLQTP
jgi:CotH protein/Big-like domain-containing protein/chitobiase/beta-hexosaminidase-like protein/lamin tail-like protein